MSTDYDPQGVIPVPRMTASKAATIGQAIEAAYGGEKKLPDNLVRAFAILRGANGFFKRALYTHLEPVNETQHLEESRVEAANLSGFHAMLVATANSSIKKKAALAARLQAQIFADGLAFLRLPTAERWMVTEAKLVQIKEQKLEPDIHAVGAGDFLAAFQESHKALGDAAGITSPIAVTAKSGVQVAYDKWKAAMRCYIAQVVANQALAVAEATSDEVIQAANDLAARLLAPIASVDSSQAPSKSEDAPPAPPPASAAAPAPAPADAKSAATP
jgi:hypothetical protein